jgi:regulator of sirC expression with transglutaminase-like and TPR domain
MTRQRSFRAEMADLLLRKEEEDRIQAMEHDDERAAKDHDTVRAMWLGYLDRREREKEDKFDEEEERELLSFLNKNMQDKHRYGTTETPFGSFHTNN